MLPQPDAYLVTDCFRPTGLVGGAGLEPASPDSAKGSPGSCEALNDPPCPSCPIGDWAVSANDGMALATGSLAGESHPL